MDKEVVMRLCFCTVSEIKEIASPEKLLQAKVPKRTKDGKFDCTSLLLSHNSLESLSGMDSVLNDMLKNPQGLRWLDLSFNGITRIEDIIVECCPQLHILYLHGNDIKKVDDVHKLGKLDKLHTLTLHGNPIEDQRNYRSIILCAVKTLKRLDFSVVSKANLATAQNYEQTAGKKKKKKRKSQES